MFQRKWQGEREMKEKEKKKKKENQNVLVDVVGEKGEEGKKKEKGKCVEEKKREQDIGIKKKVKE